MTIPSWFVIVMGIGTVFIGLISIIILCKLLGAVCTLIDNKQAQPQAVAAPAPVYAAPAQSNTKSTINRQEVIAAIGVAIAEELDVDVNAIRITSIKKI